MTLKVVLRDENPDIIDEFLLNGKAVATASSVNRPARSRRITFTVTVFVVAMKSDPTL